MTPAFHDCYCDEMYAIVSSDFIASSGDAPVGVDLERLEADLAELVQDDQ